MCTSVKKRERERGRLTNCREAFVQNMLERVLSDFHMAQKMAQNYIMNTFYKCLFKSTKKYNIVRNIEICNNPFIKVTGCLSVYTEGFR